MMQLDRALYDCVESAALSYDNLRETMEHLGYKRNQYNMCVFDRKNEQGVLCTAEEHLDNLLITSASADHIAHCRTHD